MNLSKFGSWPPIFGTSWPAAAAEIGEKNNIQIGRKLANQHWHNTGWHPNGQYLRILGQKNIFWHHFRSITC
jgi:hypothetical protein